ncbi:hypothetical protein VN23_09270 [Janthinobacterium sp. B9-8]|nr:hypothetical protein VN23_09270 [Janthinobacterium sp. B9-8]
MKERPILFNAAMVNAILAGNKTQTRRVVKRQPPSGHQWQGWVLDSTCSADVGSATWARGDGPLMQDVIRAHCPLGKVGDRLWLREAFGEVYDWCDHPEMPGCPTERWHLDWKYRADGEVNRQELDGAFTGWKPSIHMPRAASRITLEITAIRVERLKDISEQDARAEGCEASGWMPSYSNPDNAGCDESLSAADNFCDLWQSIYGPESWGTNPWVWVIEFKRITP